MRKIRIASAKNPDNDFIELNNFNGFLCTQFQTLGISRKVEFLTIKNRNIPVDNKPQFKKYSLTIEIFSLYSEYEAKYYELLSFLDRNKKNGIRLYYKPYDNMEERYCLCSIESSSKTEKRQPIVLTLSQDSLWLGVKNVRHTSQQDDSEGNLFVFDDDNGYYSVSFSIDANIPKYYCVAFYGGITQHAEMKIESYNEVPLNIIIKGYCVNPRIALYKKGENKVFKEFQVFEEIGEGYYLEINSGILENGVWEVNQETGEKRDLTEKVNYEYGSPYFYLENGEYYIVSSDDGGNACITDISWQEEYSE